MSLPHCHSISDNSLGECTLSEYQLIDDIIKQCVEIKYSALTQDTNGHQFSVEPFILFNSVLIIIMLSYIILTRNK